MDTGRVPVLDGVAVSYAKKIQVDEHFRRSRKRRTSGVWIDGSGMLSIETTLNT